MALPQLDLQPVAHHMEPTPQQIAAALRILHENQRRIMEAWRALQNVIQDIETKLARIRL